VFPDDPSDVAMAKLADAIFNATRISSPDPVADWAAHNARLKERQEWLTGMNFRALKYSGPGTDLTLGLADGHAWKGGASVSRNGIACNPNIPSEEVFTTPHRLRVEGVVRSTKPLSHNGTLISDIAVKFIEGRIVEAHASRGEDVLIKAMDTDEGGRRIGEVALVPHSSPISKSGILFYNTLFDENAASHIALGQCYSECFIDGKTITAEEVARRGGNSSFIHIDWMIGSGEMDVDGIGQDGSITPVMRQGEWA
jgi:aminopeptidase